MNRISSYKKLTWIKDNKLDMVLWLHYIILGCQGNDIWQSYCSISEKPIGHGAVTVVLRQGRQINEEIAILAPKREQQLRPVRQALLDSSTSTNDQQAHHRLDQAEDNVRNTFRQIRHMLDELKRAQRAAAADSHVRSQIGDSETCSGKSNSPTNCRRSSIKNFGRRYKDDMRSQRDARPAGLWWAEYSIVPGTKLSSI